MGINLWAKTPQTLQERFGYPEPLPDNAGPVDSMRHRLKTTEGRRLYGKRKSTVEPVFGIIKEVMGFRQFQLRGFEAVSIEIFSPFFFMSTSDFTVTLLYSFLAVDIYCFLGAINVMILCSRFLFNIF